MKREELLVYLHSCKNVDQKYVVLWIIERTFHNKIQVEFQFDIKVATVGLTLGKWKASKISMYIPFVLLKMCYTAGTSENESGKSNFKFYIRLIQIF
jgi:hypothetical protein